MQTRNLVGGLYECRWGSTHAGQGRNCLRVQRIPMLRQRWSGYIQASGELNKELSGSIVLRQRQHAKTEGDPV